MELIEKDAAALTAEFGITVGRWEQYGLPEGTLPFGAMWSIVPPGGVSAEDHHEEQELAVVISGDGEVESTATGERRVTPPGTAALMGSYERHVWHNRSAEAPLVFLSLYWTPSGQ
jgi:uncharacterized cupin superfamily protein